MIVDHIDNWRLYSGAHSLFSIGFECLQDTDWSNVADGRFEISGDDVFAIVDRRIGKGKQTAALEVHRRYIDIQYMVRGRDVMGYRALTDCYSPETFDVDRDVAFLGERPQSWFDVKQNCFAIFYPTDAHAPMGTTEEFHKVVVKVRV
jgi:YhcH/YjgK/YiaL family protein